MSGDYLRESRSQEPLLWMQRRNQLRARRSKENWMKRKLVAGSEAIECPKQPLKAHTSRPQGGGKPATVTKYRRVKKPEHPLADKDGMVRVHRVVLFEKLAGADTTCHWCGRTLSWAAVGISRIVTDHLDDDGWNNEPENLVPACRRCNSERAKQPDFLTHCAKGHAYDQQNTYQRPDGGGRQCRTCNSARRKLRTARDRQKRRLVAGKEATLTTQQHRRCCNDCPWGREALQGWLGRMSIDEWLQSAHGEDTVECHAQKGPNGPWACAGITIYRANVAKRPHDPNAMKLPPDRESVFTNPMQFRKHHEKRDPR